MVVGILALQGAVEPHVEMLRKLGVEALRVKRPEHLNGLSGIILPGGESTTMIHLLKLNGLWEPLAHFIHEKPTWGICAGAILLAREVSHPKQASFKAIDISVERNAYGRQTESFFTPLEATSLWDLKPVEGVFIRAPRIKETGKKVKTLLAFKVEPVLVESENILAGTFHPELTDSPIVHQYFLDHIQRMSK